MSKYSENLEVSIPAEKAMMALREACSQTGYKIISEGQNSMSVKGEIGAATWPVTVAAFITAKGEGSVIALNGSCMGFGPIQSNNVKRTVSDLKNKIIVSADKIKQMQNLQRPVKQESVSDEIQKMADLLKQGVISEEEFKAFKKNKLGL